MLASIMECPFLSNELVDPRMLPGLRLLRAFIDEAYASVFLAINHHRIRTCSSMFGIQLEHDVEKPLAQWPFAGGSRGGRVERMLDTLLAYKLGLALIDAITHGSEELEKLVLPRSRSAGSFGATDPSSPKFLRQSSSGSALATSSGVLDVAARRPPSPLSKSPSVQQSATQSQSAQSPRLASLLGTSSKRRQHETMATHFRQEMYKIEATLYEAIRGELGAEAEILFKSIATALDSLRFNLIVVHSAEELTPSTSQTSSTQSIEVAKKSHKSAEVKTSPYLQISELLTPNPNRPTAASSPRSPASSSGGSPKVSAQESQQKGGKRQQRLSVVSAALEKAALAARSGSSSGSGKKGSKQIEKMERESKRAVKTGSSSRKHRKDERYEREQSPESPQSRRRSTSPPKKEEPMPARKDERVPLLIESKGEITPEMAMKEPFGVTKVTKISEPDTATTGIPTQKAFGPTERGKERADKEGTSAKKRSKEKKDQQKKKEASKDVETIKISKKSTSATIQGTTTYKEQPQPGLTPPAEPQGTTQLKQVSEAETERIIEDSVVVPFIIVQKPGRKKNGNENEKLFIK